MIKQTTELDQVKANALKAARTAIRLKHSLAADNEIAEYLPVLERRINLALSTGQPLEITIGSIFDEV